jgi:predicted ATPase/class 3 adenylate cyclase
MSERRAILLTDVVDSTQLAERLGDAAAAELGAAHDRVARDLMRAWRGREIDKTDGMLMLFEEADDALGFVVAYHHALAALPVPLKARAGLHVGTVILRSNPAEDVAHGAKPLEVEGIAKPVAARVMSLAIGGQTLLTAEAHAALRDKGLRAPDLRMQSHGFWRIKGLAEPVELFEAGDAHAPFTPPPDSAKVYRVVQRDGLWQPLREVPHRLPSERDEFVGRQEALRELARRFEGGARLVSLLGIGGSGKTRLATRFARSWMGEFPGGVWFCDLSQARDADGIVQAVTQALDVPLGQDDPVRQLGHAIAGRGACLVILDNFEQVSRHAQETLGHWLDRAAQACFLVTTREVLGLPGEQALALPPLDAGDATALFLHRAAAARQDFRLHPEDRSTVEQVVGLLDGLPLAIELAAARVRVMSPQALLSRMGQRFKLLAAGGARRDRQATLRAAFDWSWDLLTDAEKSALAQLSVFEGGFSLDAVEQVVDLCGCAGDPWVPDVLQSLVDKSFVRSLDGRRFDLLSSVQEYAAERLRTAASYPGSGDAAELGAQARHAAHFSRFVPRESPGDMAVELDNLGIACRRSALRGDTQLAVDTLVGAWSVLQHCGPFQAGHELARKVAEMPGLQGAQRARVAVIEGCALQACGDMASSQRQLELALAGARDAGDRRVEAQALNSLGALHSFLGRLPTARSYHDAALLTARELADAPEECAALNGLGTVHVDLGLTEEALRYYRLALEAARGARDRRWECAVLGNLGGALFNLGRAAEAAENFAAALATAREVGSRTREVSARCNLGALHHSRGDLDVAAAELQAALSLAQSIGHLGVECVSRCNLGLVCFAREQWPEAHEHYRAALALARELKDRRSEGLFLGYLGQVQARLRHFDDARSSIGDGERLLREVADQFSLGLLMCHRVEVEHLAGDDTAAGRAFTMAEELAGGLAATGASELTQALRRAAALLSLRREEAVPHPGGA